MNERIREVPSPLEMNDGVPSMYEKSVRKFVAWTLTDDGKGYMRGRGKGFSTSGESDVDMRTVFSGDYQITGMTVNPETRHVHFRVGGTDFFIQGEAADMLFDRFLGNDMAVASNT